MNILIFSMTCGEGHNSIAKSLKTEIDRKFAGGGDLSDSSNLWV